MLYSIFGAVVENCEWRMNKGKGKGKDDGKCVERVKMWWTGNETVKGVWNTSISKLAQEKVTCPDTKALRVNLTQALALTQTLALGVTVTVTVSI